MLSVSNKLNGDHEEHQAKQTIKNERIKTIKQSLLLKELY